MDKSLFQAILRRIQEPIYQGSGYFTSKDLNEMTIYQLSTVTLALYNKWPPTAGSYFLYQELYDLIAHLDRIISIPEDQNLEKFLHMTASLVYLTRYEGFPLNRIINLPPDLALHLERIIGRAPYTTYDPQTGRSLLYYVPSMELQPSLQIATFLAYPLLEGIVRRKLSNFISKDGKVLKKFSIPDKTYHPGGQISNFEHELKLLEQKASDSALRVVLTEINKTWNLFEEIRRWRNMLLHGELTASWHSLAILLVIYLILLTDVKINKTI